VKKNRARDRKRKHRLRSHRPIGAADDDLGDRGARSMGTTFRYESWIICVSSSRRRFGPALWRIPCCEPVEDAPHCVGIGEIGGVRHLDTPDCQEP
jgi:hypothetical protein